MSRFAIFKKFLPRILGAATVPIVQDCSFDLQDGNNQNQVRIREFQLPADRLMFDQINTPSDLLRRKRMSELIHDRVALLCAQHNIQGISVAVSVHGQLKVLISQGKQDQELGVKMTSESVVNIGELSQMFVMYMLLRQAKNLNIDIHNDLVEDQFVNVDFAQLRRAIKVEYGDLTYDTAIQENLFAPVWIPDVQGLAVDMLLEYDSLVEKSRLQAVIPNRYNLGHTEYQLSFKNLAFKKSGLKGRYLPSERNRQFSMGTVEEIARYYMDFPLRFEPGAQDDNSLDLHKINTEETSSYEILAYVIQMLSGLEDWKDVVKNELAMLGLKNTALQLPTETFLNKARGTMVSDTDESMNSMFVNYWNKFGSSGFCSNVRDLDKFMNILQTSVLYDPASPPPEPLLNGPESQFLTAMHEGAMNAVVRELLDEEDPNGDFCYITRGDGACFKFEVVFEPAPANPANPPHPADINGLEPTLGRMYQIGGSMESSCIVMSTMRYDNTQCLKRYTPAEKQTLYGFRQERLSVDTYNPHHGGLHPGNCNQVRSNETVTTRESSGSGNDYKMVTVSIIIPQHGKQDILRKIAIIISEEFEKEYMI